MDLTFEEALEAAEALLPLVEWREVDCGPDLIGPFYYRFSLSSLEEALATRREGEIKALAEKLALELIQPRVNRHRKAFQLKEKKLAEKYGVSRAQIHKAKHFLKEVGVMRLWKYQDKGTGQSSWFVVTDEMLEWHF